MMPHEAWDRRRRKILNLLPSLRRHRPDLAFANNVQPRATGEAFPAPEHLGVVFPPYQAVLAPPGSFVDPAHAELAVLPEEGGLLKAETPGFLRPADALLLYELAWHATADVLELGSAWGLSATVLCRAVRNAGRGARVVSVEIEPEFQRATLGSVAALGLQEHLDPRPGAAETVMPRLRAEGRSFSVAFVDHDHSAAAVSDAARQLRTMMRPGGVAVFHDFNDRRNVSEPDTYGVHAAVSDMLLLPDWRYLGVLGCCALVQRTTP